MNKNDKKPAILLIVEWHFLYSTELNYIIEIKTQSVGGLLFICLLKYIQETQAIMKTETR